MTNLLTRAVFISSMALFGSTTLAGLSATEAAAQSREGEDEERPATAVPELDPSAAGQAGLLVLGGAALLLGRRRARVAA